MMKFSVFAAAIIAAVTYVASSGFAYHDTLRGGISIGVVLPIVIVVVIGMLGLGFGIGRSERRNQNGSASTSDDDAQPIRRRRTAVT